MTGPFGEFAEEYRRGGWQPFPIPFGTKAPPPRGVTGSAPYDVSDEQWSRWCRNRSEDNVGLRVPDGVIAIDVDDHDEKHGGATIAKLAGPRGPLPPTVRVTSRNPGSPHGHYLYRVPVGLAWRSSAGPDVEVIHSRHRYLVGTGSVVDGRTYIAYRDLLPSGLPPVADLPELPRRWAIALCLGKAGGPGAVRDASVDVGQWRDSLPRGAFSARVAATVAAYRRAPLGKGSAYDTMVSAVASLVSLGNQGEPGVEEGLDAVADRYCAIRGGDRDAGAEFRRALAGAVQKHLGAPPAVTVLERSRRVVRRG